MNLQLLKKSNPLLFAPERYDEYPLDPIELSQFLNNSLQQEDNSNLLRDRPFTSVDQLDYLFYVDPKTQELDLEKKMAVEYALFQLQLLRQDNDELNDKITSFEELRGDDLKTVDGLRDLLLTLNSVNGLELDLNKLNLLDTKFTDESAEMAQKTGNNNNTGNTDGSVNDLNSEKLNTKQDAKYNKFNHTHNNKRNDDDIQQLTSYLLSNTIKEGIELRPQGGMNDSTEFLKNCMDSLIKIAVQNKNDTSNTKTHSSNDSEVDNQQYARDPDSFDQKYQALETKLTEMTTAFNDLKLAHSFLTKQYENDHNDSSKDIEKLSRTNKELQEKLLSYHSSLAKREAKDNRSSNEHSRTNSIFNSPSKNLSSPVLGYSDNWIPQTPSTSEANGDGTSINSPSLSMMKSEFRRLLTETQRRYEREISQERQKRKQLQAELNLVKK
ncbi:protein Pea2p [Monosporozyma servazzii]